MRTGRARKSTHTKGAITKLARKKIADKTKILAEEKVAADRKAEADPATEWEIKVWF